MSRTRIVSLSIAVMALATFPALTGAQDAGKGTGASDSAVGSENSNSSRTDADGPTDTSRGDTRTDSSIGTATEGPDRDRTDTDRRLSAPPVPREERWDSSYWRTLDRAREVYWRRSRRNNERWRSNPDGWDGRYEPFEDDSGWDRWSDMDYWRQHPLQFHARPTWPDHDDYHPLRYRGNPYETSGSLGSLGVGFPAIGVSSPLI